MLKSFIATCFGSCIRSLHQAEKVLKKSYHVKFFNIKRVVVIDACFPYICIILVANLRSQCFVICIVFISCI
jgi:hypothetical protein